MGSGPFPLLFYCNFHKNEKWQSWAGIRGKVYPKELIKSGQTIISLHNCVRIHNNFKSEYFIIEQKLYIYLFFGWIDQLTQLNGPFRRKIDNQPTPTPLFLGGGARARVCRVGFSEKSNHFIKSSWGRKYSPLGPPIDPPPPCGKRTLGIYGI